jgi:hypothetical protein
MDLHFKILMPQNSRTKVQDVDQTDFQTIRNTNEPQKSTDH